MATEVNTQQLRNEHLSNAKANLCGPGGFFETTTETIRGETYEVFANRLRSLRELLASTDKFSDREFLVLEDQRLTFADVIHLTNSAAQVLKEDLGVQKGDRVAILAANSPQWCIAFLATVSIGAIVSAFNGWWTAPEIEYGINHSQPKVIIGDSPRLERIQDLQHGVPVINIDRDFDQLLRHAPQAPTPDDPIAEDDPCVILYTSGTTGQPKGALISHRALLGFIQTTLCNATIRATAEAALAQQLAASPPKQQQQQQPPPQSITLGTSPLFHVSGLHAGLLLNLTTGGKIIYRRGRFDPEDVLRLIQAEKITSFSAIGSMGSQVARHPSFDQYDTSSIGQIGSGGAPTSPAVQQLLREKFPQAAHSMGTGYGSSESTAVIATIGGTEYVERPESCGRPGVGMDVEIRDDQNQPLPTGQQGTIFCRSAYTMLEYWNNPEATAATIQPGGWLNTGDVGMLDADGYLYINSRARDMILHNAENVYPIEIEYRLDAHPQVEESAVIGVDHPETGQEIKAVVVPLDAQAATDPALTANLTDQLSRWCAETLAKYKVPTLWEIRQQPLPRNAAGKILKTEL